MTNKGCKEYRIDNIIKQMWGTNHFMRKEGKEERKKLVEIEKYWVNYWLPNNSFSNIDDWRVIVISWIVYMNKLCIFLVLYLHYFK